LLWSVGQGRYPLEMDSQRDGGTDEVVARRLRWAALALAGLTSLASCAEGTEPPAPAGDGRRGTADGGFDADGGSEGDAGDRDAASSDGGGGGIGGDGDGDSNGGDGDGDGGGAGPWRKPLTIQGSQVPVAQTAFPVLVHITDADLAAHAGAGGLDIYFQDAGGGTLPFERESYDAATGTLIAWVKVDLTGDDQDFYVHYGDGSINERSTPASVWTGGFAAVYHMDYGGGAGTEADSTSNANHLSPPMVSSNPSSVPGKIGDALSFATPNGMLQAPDHDSLDITGALTVSMWVNKSATNPDYWEALVAKRVPPGENCNYQVSLGDDGAQRDLTFYDGSTIAGTSQTPTAGTWTHAAVVVDGTACSFYMDGVWFADASSCDLAPNSGPLFVGGTDQENDEPFYGALDEVRIAPVVRSADWLLTEVNSQKSNSTFITVGAAEDL